MGMAKKQPAFGTSPYTGKSAIAEACVVLCNN